MSSRRPALSIAVLSDLEGELEPCGCSERTEGGLDRAMHVVGRLRAQHAQLRLLVAGHLLFASGSEHADALAQTQQELKAEAMAGFLLRAQPSLVAPSTVDRARGAALIRNFRALGVSVLAEGPQGVVHRIPFEGRLSNAPGREGASLVVAFVDGAQASRAETAVDLVIHTGSVRSAAELKDGRVELYPGRHAQELWLLEFWPGREASAAWQLTERVPEAGSEKSWVRVGRHALGADVPRDRGARAQIEQSLLHIEQVTRSAVLRRPLIDPESSFEATRTFVGSENCAPCHLEAYAWWRQSPHGRAFKSLEHRGRALDLACVGCHVTGFGAKGGATLGRLAELRDVGCESCHGPGARHIAEPRARPISVQAQPELAICAGCHDAEHSPAFDAAAMRIRLVAPGHGRR